MNLLVNSCLYGFGFLTLTSYILTEHTKIYVGCLISMFTGILCHSNENEIYCFIDKMAVFSIGFVNIIDFLIISQYYVLNILLLINVFTILWNYYYFSITKFSKINHFYYIHLHSYTVILYLIICRYLLNNIYLKND